LFGLAVYLIISLVRNAFNFSLKVFDMKQYKYLLKEPIIKLVINGKIKLTNAVKQVIGCRQVD